MKFKKLLASSLLCGLCIFSSIPVHASEVEGPDTGIQRTEAADLFLVTAHFSAPAPS